MSLFCICSSGAGADFVMMGGMLAGHDQCTGEIIEKNGKKYKLFYGMSSDTAMKKYVGGVAEYRWDILNNNCMFIDVFHKWAVFPTYLFSLRVSGHLRDGQWRFHTEETWNTPSVTCWEDSAPRAPTWALRSSKSWAGEPPLSVSHNSLVICSLSGSVHTYIYSWRLFVHYAESIL